jgi:hypothetical protein
MLHYIGLDLSEPFILPAGQRLNKAFRAQPPLIRKIKETVQYLQQSQKWTCYI